MITDREDEMARSRRLRCVCGTPVLSVNDQGLELRCDCGETTLIPYEQLSGIEHLVRFAEAQGADRRRKGSVGRRSSTARRAAGRRGISRP